MLIQAISLKTKLNQKEKEEYSKIVNSVKFNHWLNNNFQDFRETFLEYLKMVENNFYVDKYGREIFKFSLRKQVELYNLFTGFTDNYIKNNITKLIPQYILLDFWEYINNKRGI